MMQPGSTPTYRTLREFFKQTGTRHDDFARVVGVAPSYISMLVSGQRRPSLAIAVRIAALAQIPIESLLGKAA